MADDTQTFRDYIPPGEETGAITDKGFQDYVPAPQPTHQTVEEPKKEEKSDEPTIEVPKAEDKATPKKVDPFKDVAESKKTSKQEEISQPAKASWNSSTHTNKKGTGK